MQEQDNFLLGNEDSLRPCLQRRYNQHEERESKYMTTAYGPPHQWYNAALYYNNWGSKYAYSPQNPKPLNPFQPPPNAHSYTQVLPLGSSYSERSPSHVLASPIDPTYEASSVDDSYFPIRDEYGTGSYPNSVEHNYFKPSIGYPYNDHMKPILADVSHVTQDDAENATSTIESTNDDMNSSANSTNIAPNPANNDPPTNATDTMKVGLEKTLSLPITTKVHIRNNDDNQTGLNVQYGDAIGKEKHIQSNLKEPIENTNMKDFLAKENHSNIVPGQIMKIMDEVTQTKLNGLMELTESVSKNHIDVLHKEDTNLSHMRINSKSNFNHRTSETNASLAKQQELSDSQIITTKNRNMPESGNNSEGTTIREHFTLNKPDMEELQSHTQFAPNIESSNPNNSTREFQTKLDNFLNKYMMKTKYTSQQTTNVSSNISKQPNYISIISLSKLSVPQKSQSGSDSFRIKQNYSKVYFYPSYLLNLV
uniref:Uncharacterized protein n=1 Tax=Cacopsylla melanoneura TaxID=428564 RepID=A0A8D8Z2Y1_9HEMI